jgi:hypothetical protein
MKKKKKKNTGLLILFMGAIFLIISLLVNRYVEISDIYCFAFLILSLAVELLGLYKIIKETK